MRTKIKKPNLPKVETVESRPQKKKKKKKRKLSQINSVEFYVIKNKEAKTVESRNCRILPKNKTSPPETVKSRKLSNLTPELCRSPDLDQPATTVALTASTAAPRPPGPTLRRQQCDNPLPGSSCLLPPPPSAAPYRRRRRRVSCGRKRET